MILHLAVGMREMKKKLSSGMAGQFKIRVEVHLKLTKKNGDRVVNVV